MAVTAGSGCRNECEIGNGRNHRVGSILRKHPAGGGQTAATSAFFHFGGLHRAFFRSTGGGTDHHRGQQGAGRDERQNALQVQAFHGLNIHKRNDITKVNHFGMVNAADAIMVYALRTLRG